MKLVIFFAAPLPNHLDENFSSVVLHSTTSYGLHKVLISYNIITSYFWVGRQGATPSHKKERGSGQEQFFKHGKAGFGGALPAEPRLLLHMLCRIPSLAAGVQDSCEYHHTTHQIPLEVFILLDEKH